MLFSQIIDSPSPVNPDVHTRLDAFDSHNVFDDHVYRLEVSTGASLPFAFSENEEVSSVFTNTVASD